MGMTVFSGMLAATVLGVLVIPALYVLIQKMTGQAEAAAERSGSQEAGG
jgi:Cu/Ag efflux pump CusA